MEALAIEEGAPGWLIGAHERQSIGSASERWYHCAAVLPARERFW
jgi:hypothetical protein